MPAHHAWLQIVLTELGQRSAEQHPRYNVCGIELSIGQGSPSSRQSPGPRDTLTLLSFCLHHNSKSNSTKRETGRQIISNTSAIDYNSTS